MFYGLHTTTKAERDALLQRSGVLTEINPADFHQSTHKDIVCEEDTKNYYEHSYAEFHELLKTIETEERPDLLASKYYARWKYKGNEVATRILRLPKLLADIKKNGITEPVHCEVTGERLDGSYRTKIAMYLGIKSVPAIVHRFKWIDVTEDFIERKLKARQLSTGKDYYEFSYGYKDWKNVESGGPVYRENAERASTIVPLITGKTVLDVGCNEGYISIQAALAGHSVVGVDHDFNHVAYLNKLIFEFVNKKDIDVEFIQKDIRDITETADTVLLLNVLYHIPKDQQVTFLKKFDGKQLIFQCNLRKERERDTYYTSHPEDLLKLLSDIGRKGTVIQWRDKPIIISNG